MKLETYKHIDFTHKPNKYQIDPIEMKFADMDEFNKVYNFVKDRFMKVEPTKSGSMPYNRSCKLHSRYMVVQNKAKIELTVVSYLGCYRFVIGNNRNEIKNPVSGMEAVRKIYEKANEFGIDLTKYQVSPDQGEQIKTEIESPHIEMYGIEGRVYTNVHHLDLNSSYASRIIEKYPEFKDLYEYMYNQRHNNNDYYKHVLTNHIGCWQSKYCPAYNMRGKMAPYQFAELAKIAVNETRHTIEDYIIKLRNSGRKVLLTNTDGIWYQGELFHDENEGINLCQWKNDHKNCTFIMKSKGAYQFIEENQCHTVVRGTTLLDLEKSREDWQFGEIFNQVLMEYYSFDENKGVIKHVEKI